jgi:IS1 family transposase
VKEQHVIAVYGDRGPSKISSSHVERQNLTMRMQIFQLTRLTNAFSKKLESYKAAIALRFACYKLLPNSLIACA